MKELKELGIVHRNRGPNWVIKLLRSLARRHVSPKLEKPSWRLFVQEDKSLALAIYIKKSLKNFHRIAYDDSIIKLYRDQSGMVLAKRIHIKGRTRKNPKVLIQTMR